MSPEKKEITEKKGVIFIILNNGKIQLEKRVKLGDQFFGHTIIPGGGIKQDESQQTALCREVIEEYGALPLRFKKIGEIVSSEEGGLINTRHVYLITKWLGVLGNPEKKNPHLEVDFVTAKSICRHPVSQQVLNLLDEELSRQNS